MNRLIFNHADKDLQFIVSSVPWGEQFVATEQKDPSLPATGPQDAGKFLVVMPDGSVGAAAVPPGAVDFNTKQFTITGNLGSPEANLNAMTTPLVVQPSQLVFVHDTESGQGHVWVGGTGTFGYQAGGTTVTGDMLMEVKGGDVDVAFTTPQEVNDPLLQDKAINPESARNLDLDGGTY